jgi:hypothetical protein
VSASYRAQVGVALEVLAEGLAPFVDSEMRTHFPGEDWIVTAATRLGKREPVLASPTDPQFQLEVMVRWWGPVFAPRLSRHTRDTVQDLRKARNDWAHIDDSHPIDIEYARRIHTLAEDLLQEIGSPMAEELARLAEQLQRDAARHAAEEQGVSESEALILQLTQLQAEREALSRQLDEAQNVAKQAVGHQRAVARQLAELQAQYAAVSGLRERYREVQTQLDEARQVGEREAQDVTSVRNQLETTEQAVIHLQQESSRLHTELQATRERLTTIDPAATVVGRRWLWLYAALVLVLGIAVLLATLMS